MSYALATLWHERQRYLPGILAVAFSALLIALQCGLLMGLFSITSLPIDHTDADIWMGAPSVLSVDLGRPIRASSLAKLQAQPSTKNLPIIILTAKGQAQDAAMAQEVWGAAVIAKPFEPQKLKSLVSVTLEKGKCPEASQASYT